MSELNLIDLLDEASLPLKNRVDKGGYYVPKTPSNLPIEILDDKTDAPKCLIPTEPLKEGEQYRFHFDMSRCVGCNCCVVACNEQNNNPANVNWRRVGEIEGGTYPDTKKFHLSMGCNHCLDPSCLTGCPTEAYVKLDDGIVKHQAEECIGCRYCTWNCAYGVPQFNEERKIVTKCDMCHSRLKEGQSPACVAACPESAIQIEKVNIAEWRENHGQADAPHVPDSEISLSTTRITLPKDLPQDVLRANRHQIQPEEPHASLILMTVLTQMATGGFLTLWLGHMLSQIVSFLKPLQGFLAFGASGMLIVTGIALSAAIFHLGRPLFAYKALRMWKRSWLSREVLLFALFSKIGAGYAGLLLAEHFWKLGIPSALLFVLGGLVSAVGLLGVYASAKIYLVPARPAWNTIRTPLRFFLTGFVLGPLFALVVYAGYIHAQIHTQMLPSGFAHFGGPAMAFLIVSSLAGFGQLVVLLSRLFSLRSNESSEQYGSTFLLIHHFKTHFILRIALLVLGSFVIPFGLFHFLSLGEISPVIFSGLAFSAFGLSICGELLGRYLFFVTVVPKNMPGSFFSGNGHQ
jgi:formate dehydrogenase iron-sulfur subunit